MVDLPHKGISQTHENEVHRALTTVGLDPNDFDWEHVEGVGHRNYTVPRLYHRRD